MTQNQHSCVLVQVTPNSKLFTLELADRVLVAAENGNADSANRQQLQLDCSRSAGLMGELQSDVALRTGRTCLALHLVPVDVEHGYSLNGNVTARV